MSRFKEAFKKFSLGAIRVGVGVGLVFIFKTLGLG